MVIRIHPETPDPRQIRKVVELLRDGAVIIYPTDGGQHHGLLPAGGYTGF